MHEDKGLILDPSRWVKNTVLLWLWCRLADAGKIGPLAWELPYAAGAAPKRQKKKKILLIMMMRDSPYTLTLLSVHMLFCLETTVAASKTDMKFRRSHFVIPVVAQ